MATSASLYSQIPHTAVLPEALCSRMQGLSGPQGDFHGKNDYRCSYGRKFVRIAKKTLRK